jgi:hypothetical protein
MGDILKPAHFGSHKKNGFPLKGMYLSEMRADFIH